MAKDKTASSSTIHGPVRSTLFALLIGNVNNEADDDRSQWRRVICRAWVASLSQIVVPSNAKSIIVYRMVRLRYTKQKGEDAGEDKSRQGKSALRL